MTVLQAQHVAYIIIQKLFDVLLHHTMFCRADRVYTSRSRLVLCVVQIEGFEMIVVKQLQSYCNTGYLANTIYREFDALID